MTKKDLIHRIGRDCGLTRHQASRALRSISRTLGAGLGRGERARLHGLGTFSVARSPKRTGRRSQAASRTRLRRRRMVHFIPARALQRKIS